MYDKYQPYALPWAVSKHQVVPLNEQACITVRGDARVRVRGPTPGSASPYGPVVSFLEQYYVGSRYDVSTVFTYGIRR